MKILYSCLSQSWGGMEMFTVHAVEQLLKRNIPTELLCYPGSKLEEDAKNRGIVTHAVKAKGYFNPSGISRVAGLIKKGGFNIIHTQASKDLWVLVPGAKLAGSKIPILLTKQVGSYIVKKDFLHKWVYGRLDYALAISEVIAKNLVDTCPIPQSKIKLLHNAVDVNKFDPEKANRNKVRKQFGLKDEHIVIGMLARFSPGKGHEDFLHAAEKLNGKYANLKFMIVGEPSRGEDNYGSKIVNMSKILGIEEDVIFTGFRKDTPDVISAMDIFAFPSHNEAFGIALAEAMAMKIPSVVSNADGVLDIAVDGETSLLFEVKNSDDLAEKLEVLINSPSKRKQFGDNSRKRIIENFEIDLLTNRVIDYYKQALEEKGIGI